MQPRLTPAICDEIIAELRKGWTRSWGGWRHDEEATCLLGASYRVLNRHYKNFSIPRADAVIVPIFYQIVLEQFSDQFCSCEFCERDTIPGQKRLLMTFNDFQMTVKNPILVVEKVRADC